MPKNYALFDGNALVAERGIVVYSGAFGLAKRKAKLPYTTTAPAQILIRPICRCVAIRSLGSFLRIATNITIFRATCLRAIVERTQRAWPTVRSVARGNSGFRRDE